MIPPRMPPHSLVREAPTAKERVGQVVHHPVVSVAIVLLILASVGMVCAQLLLPPHHAAQQPLETAQLVISGVFALELSLKAWVAPDRAVFLWQYWLDIIAIIPWVHSLRVLRVLRLLRVFRAALILSRRVGFVSQLVRSGLGEYAALGLIVLVLIASGTLALHHAERDLLLADHPDVDPERLEDWNRRQEPEQRHELAEPENALWATVFFLVANEPMVAIPRTGVGKAVALLTMFGGLTTFAVFTGVVTALMVNRLRRRMEIDDMDRYHLTRHLVICGWNNRVPLVLEEVLSAEREFAIVIVADLAETPPEVARLDGAGRVFFVRGDFTRPEVLEQARIHHAERAILCSDSTKERSDQDRDARTVLAALMIERMNPTIHTCAELLNRQNEYHLRMAGVEEVVVTSEAGGHHLALAALHAGLSKVVQELLTVKQGQALCKLKVPDGLRGATFAIALERLKREQDALLIGLEVRGQDGAKAEGYQLLVNPSPETVLGERDNLILITFAGKQPEKAT
jgi:voltage-gated potassium channel